MELSYKLEVFEGPLDLLLHLIEKNELDIRDIKIALLLDQFMEYVREYEQANLENLSEFLLMASRLLYIKSKQLLPPEDEDDDPMGELTAMLADYARYKELAADFEDRMRAYGAYRLVRDPQPLPPAQAAEKSYPADKLVEAYRAVFRGNLRRVPPPVSAFEGIVAHRTVSVASKAVSLLRRLIKQGGMRFLNILGEQGTKSEKIACFLAILELSNRGRVQITDAGCADYKINLVREGEKR
jgi:segregation and condensation protein A